jgi:4-alpha-glucanotransferase
VTDGSVAELGELGELAGEFGVQTWFWDTQGQRRDASPDGLVAVLRSLGAPVERGGDLGELRRFVESGRVRPVEPVVVGHEGEPIELDVRVPTVGGPDRVVVHLQPEAAEPMRFEISLDRVPEVGRVVADGREHTVRRVRLDLGPSVGIGYHRVTVELAGGLHATTLVVAPRQVPQPGSAERTWGVFAALYGCRPDDLLGPNVNDLARIGSWIDGLGGRVVATLPILATYLSQPYDPSPYAPVSQRYWNELYLDIAATPELASSARARRLLDDPATRAAGERLRAADLFDHRGRYALVRPVLDALAATCLSAPAAARADFDQWVGANPDAVRYANFRAATDRTGTGWHAWGLGPGRLPGGEEGSPEAATHLWAQWTMNRQLTGVATTLEAKDLRLYLDLPVGTSGDGYDTWADHELYAWGCGVGAPPDDFFGAGQNWGFPPVDPFAARAQGHRQLAASLRHHLSAAGVLRLDHVMGFHRLYWVPDGMPASEGVYVRYPADEMFAVLAVESSRRGARVVGEDLGTVPDEVRDALDRYGIGGMYVSQFQLPDAPGRPIPMPRRHQVASLDTHDTPTFAAWWRADDIALRHRLGLFGEDQAADDTGQRAVDREAIEVALRDAGVLHGEADEHAVLGALVELLGASEATTVLVAVDDLVHETDPQNVPGTASDRPNWVRMQPCDLPELFSDPSIEALLRRLQGSRLGAHTRATEEAR